MPNEWRVSDVDFCVWDMRQSEWPRARKRAFINGLFNGAPPYSDKEVQDNGITINVNDLSGPREAHNARAQIASAFMKPGAYFTATTDAGTRHKRSDYGRTVTNRAAKIMKRKLQYFEMNRSVQAMTILHGIAPTVNVDKDRWFGRAVAIDDVLVPGDTELVMDDLPFFAVFRKLTGPQLIKLAKGPKPDPAWNQPMVNECLRWIDDQTTRFASNYWPDFWKPEAMEERIKGDGAYYAADRVPTINVFEFYFWNDKKDVSGWNRRIILDAWTMPDAQGIRGRRSDGDVWTKDEFLYNPKDRKYASNLSEIINWQFADLSAVAPFHYHTVRSLGFLLYSVCHLQNRLRCKFNEAMFEQLMVLMRIKSQDDMERALSVNLMNRGFIDDTVQFIPAAERYQVNAALAQMGLAENQNLITRNASSYTSKLPSSSEKQVTATQWMGEEQKVTQLVSAGLMQMYEYCRPQYREVFRRLCKKNSTDCDARVFQAKCIRDGVPPEVLYEFESWDIEPERVMGSGNKSLEMMIAQQLMAYRHLYDPDAQRLILRDFTLATTDDAARTESYVPEVPHVSNSVLDAQQSVGTLLMAQPMELRQNVSHFEYASALIEALNVEVAKINAIGGVPESQSEIMGMQNLAGVTIEGQPVPGNGAQNHIALVAQDKESKSQVKQLSESLSEAMNQVKAFKQRLDEKMQSQNGNGQIDPETLAKIESDRMITDAKIQQKKESHAVNTANRQIAFEMEQERENQKTMAELQRENARLQQELSAQAAKAVIEIEKSKATASQAKKPENQ